MTVDLVVGEEKRCIRKYLSFEVRGLDSANI